MKKETDMKYIDAEKLIERLEEMKQAEYENCGGVNSKTGALQEVQKLIDSLQEEQTPTEREIAEAHRDAEMIRERDKARIQQEQPEVDLQKEIDVEWAKCNPTDEGMGVEVANIHIEQFDAIARHFFELGLNAKR